MLASKPQYRKEAKAYCGRKVRKAFFPEGGGKSSYFLGTVVEVPIFDGEVCYKIEYEDGDIEDIAWEELVDIMIPDHAAASGSLKDTTNLAEAHGKASGKPAGRDKARNQPTGLVTPVNEEGPDTSEPDIAVQQRRVQRNVRPRMCNLDDEPVVEQAGDQDEIINARGRTRRHVDTADDDSAPDDGEQPEERPRKRRPGVNEDNAPDDARQALAQAAEDTAGFVARSVGLAGQIMKIRVENFMCHQHFELDFGPHVTFINGANGSGKSAVVQALQICLGVTARNTGRGTAIAELIRTGSNDAKVQVTLWNTGEDAFMPSVFGDRITVERNLKRQGASTYALLDARGRKAALDRGEKPKDVLDRMLDHFTVDANNPLNIITQDKSRSLLGDKGNAKDKYEMFMAGTLLDKVQDDLKAANAQVAAMMKNFEETVARFNADKQEELQLSSRVQKLRDADKFLRERAILEKAIAWRAVQQTEERVMAAKTAAEARGPELLADYDRYFEGIACAKQELQSRRQELEAELAKHDEIMAGHQTHIHGLIGAEKDARIGMERAKRSKSTAQNALETLQNEQKALDDQLAKETSGKAAEARRLVEEHQKLVTAKQAALQEASDAVNAAAQALDAAKKELDEISKQEQSARQNVQHTSNLIGDYVRQLRQLDAEQGDRLGIFHAVQLNQLINQNVRRFQQRPIGPIGAQLTMTDSKWILAAEVALGSLLRDYLVSCSADAVLLRQLMKQAKYNASVVIVPFGAAPHNVPPGRLPANGVPSLLDVLRVQDASVQTVLFNYLIDKQHIESTALAENGQQGQSVTCGGAAGSHIIAAIDVGGNWYRRNEKLTWTERNDLVRRQQCRLVADVSEYKASLERDLEQTEAQLGAHREDLAKLSSELQQARARAEQCAAQFKMANSLKVRAQTELSRLVAAAPEMPRFEDDEEAGVVLTQLASIQAELAGSQMQLQNADEALAVAEQMYRQAVQQAKDAKARYAEQIGQGNQLRQQLSDAATELTELDAVRAAAAGKCEQVKVQLLKLRRGVEVAEGLLQQALVGANEVCDRAEGEEGIRQARELVTAAVDKQLAKARQRDRQIAGMGVEELRRMLVRTVEAQMDCAGLEKQLAAVNKAIAQAESEAGCSDLQELEIRLAAQSKTVATRSRAYKRMEDMVHRFQTSYANQMQSFERLRTSLMDITQAKFIKYLRRRDHDGRLEFNHAERKLILHVKPKGRTNKDAQAVQDLKQLSGGERSFTTVALLLAIGESTESPFRCNDEFDVYMDEINRRVATETLLEFAMEHSTFQYIFLTPQEIATVETARQQLMKRRKVQLPPSFMHTIAMHPPRANAMQV